MYIVFIEERLKDDSSEFDLNFATRFFIASKAISPSGLHQLRPVD
jgi:hypothetical protein